MTPDLRPYLRQAIAELPTTWAENTYASCWTVLARALQLAGSEWAFIGKSGSESGFAPLGFLPRLVPVTRPDGEVETVRITHLSHDACWHLPSQRQVKAIVNSAANSDPRPEIHGPAQIGGDIIPPEHYRYTNPPILQRDVLKAYPVPEPSPAPTPPPAAPPEPRFPPRDDAMRFYVALNRHYEARGRRPLTLAPIRIWGSVTDDLYVDPEGQLVWLQEYLRLRVAGVAHEEAVSKVLALIDLEWPKEG